MYACESWNIQKADCWRIDAFELWCWRRLLRVPWTARRANQSILKEISPEYSLEGLMLKLKLQHFGHLRRRADSFEKTLMVGKIEGRRRRDDRGWDGWMASLTQWAWVWVNSRSWWWTGRPGALQSMGSQRVRHDWVTELTESHRTDHTDGMKTQLWLAKGTCPPCGNRQYWDSNTRLFNLKDIAVSMMLRKILIPVFSVVHHMAPGILDNSVCHIKILLVAIYRHVHKHCLRKSEHIIEFAEKSYVIQGQEVQCLSDRSRNWNILSNRVANLLTLQEVRYNGEPFILLSLNCRGSSSLVSRNLSLLVEAGFQRMAWQVDIQIDANHSMSTLPHLENGETGLDNNSSW